MDEAAGRAQESAPAADIEARQGFVTLSPVPPKAQPVELREIVALLAALVAADFLLYPGGGYAGWGLMVLISPFAVWFGMAHKGGCIRTSAYGALGMALLVGARLIWLGDAPTVILGCAVVAAFCCALGGRRCFPGVTTLWFFTALLSGIWNIFGYANGLRKRARLQNITMGGAVLAPFVALLTFAFIFTMANPVFREWVGSRIGDFFEWIRKCPITLGRVWFWAFVAIVFSGAMRGRLGGEELTRIDRMNESSTAGGPESLSSEFLAARNTLVALIVLFAAYLSFEFVYLWLRPIPKGFQYSAYAHEGAAWLTLALAVATFTLGAIFHGRLAHDPRAGFLERLAWVWSAGNFLLAVAVFHRTQIYVHYNGMSRMRMVALFGIGVVIAGYALVIVMVRKRRNLLWLTRRQLWALAATLCLLAVTPVDWFVTRHNVRRIMAGDLPPSVQIAHHPIGASGICELLPLLACSDLQIREGVKAVLADSEIELRQQVRRFKEVSWTHCQVAAAVALSAMGRHSAEWKAHSGDAAYRSRTLKMFRSYTQKWYD